MCAVCLVLECCVCVRCVLYVHALVCVHQQQQPQSTSTQNTTPFNNNTPTSTHRCGIRSQAAAGWGGQGYSAITCQQCLHHVDHLWGGQTFRFTQHAAHGAWVDTGQAEYPVAGGWLVVIARLRVLVYAHVWCALVCTGVRSCLVYA